MMSFKQIGLNSVWKGDIDTIFYMKIPVPFETWKYTYAYRYKLQLYLHGNTSA